MIKFVRVLGGRAMDVITRPNSFKLEDTYHPDLIHTDLGGTAPQDEGYVQIPVATTVVYRDIYDPGTGTFSTPPDPGPPPPPPTSAEEMWEVFRGLNLVTDADVPGDRRQPPRRP